MKRLTPLTKKIFVIYFYVIIIVIGFNILRYNFLSDVIIFSNHSKPLDKGYYNGNKNFYINDNIYNLDNDNQDQNNMREGEERIDVYQVPVVPSKVLYFKFVGKFDQELDQNEARRCQGIDDKFYYLVRKPIYPNQTVDMEIYNDYVHQFLAPDQRKANGSLPRLLYSIEPPHSRTCEYNKTCFQFFNFKLSYESQADIRMGFDTQDINAFITFKKVTLAHLIKIKNQFKKDYETMKYTNASQLLPHQTSLPLVNWFCSNCNFVHSNRKLYVEELMKHMVVDSYGSCLNNMPPTDFLKRTSDDPFERKKLVLGKYKFTIVFENSICKDYISEKVLDALVAGSVPVYMGHPNTLKYLPYNSYVWVGDFENAKQLADHLKYLAENDEEYYKLLSWRNNETAIEQWQGVNNFPYKAGFRFRELQCSMLRHFQRLQHGIIPIKKLKYVPFDEVCLPGDYYKFI
ncbi:hypothetical protein ACTA71_002113 [Dictyostelium dimigraforme]